MEVVHKRCCGLDVHKDTVVACLLAPEAGEICSEDHRSAGGDGALVDGVRLLTRSHGGPELVCVSLYDHKVYALKAPVEPSRFGHRHSATGASPE
jgi:hypothetical protein